MRTAARRRSTLRDQCAHIGGSSHKLMRADRAASGSNGSFDVFANAANAVPDKSDCLIDVRRTAVKGDTKPINRGIVADVQLRLCALPAARHIHEAMLHPRVAHEC